MFTQDMSLGEKVLVLIDSILNLEEEEDGSIVATFESEEVKELYELYSELVADEE
jgi:hypothetical protein